MLRKTSKSKVKPADSLLETTKKKDVELTEKDLDKVIGGKVHTHDIPITKKVDKATPYLT